MPNTTQDRESWKNSIEGRVVLKQYGQRGDLTDVVIPGGRVFHITPEERRINQEMAANTDLDMFMNGMLVPVRLLDDSEETAEFLSNPNIVGETEMKEMFKQNWKKFDERVSAISNYAALLRLVELAKDPENGATVRQVEVIQDRLKGLDPTVANEHVTVEIGRATTIRPVQPD